MDAKLSNLAIFFANAEGPARIHKTIDAHLKNLTTILENPDKFRPSFHVPSNPPHVILTFSSTSASGPTCDGSRIGSGEDTLEAQLKRAVVRNAQQNFIGAIGVSQNRAVGMKGMSGVGKSCALRGLATDDEVRNFFQDGIYWLLLGKDCTPASLVCGIARITEQSGGLKTSKSIRDDADIDAAITKAGHWFAGKRCLLLTDDVCEIAEIGRDIVRRLSQILDIQKGSRVTFTTRERDVVPANSELIEFSKRNPETSRQILLRAAGATKQDVRDLKALVDDSLDLCDGLPMALSVVGSAVRSRHENGPNLSMERVWRAYLHVLKNQPQALVCGRVTDDRYQNLRSAFQASLLTLDEERHESRMSYSEVYRALVVIQRQGWLPIANFRLLLGLMTESEAEEIAHRLATASLAEFRKGVVNRRETLGITLHDLQLDFVEDECRSHGEEQKWHGILVVAWKSMRSSEYKTGIPEELRWALNGVFEDEYVRQNVCRHIVGAGRARELSRLLLDPEWVVKRLTAGEILGLEEDLKMLENFWTQNGSCDSKRGSVGWSVRMIAGAARLSAPHILRNKREAWFQIYARLYDMRTSSKILEDYSRDIERYAARPWLRAVKFCLIQPGGALYNNLICDFEVRGISKFTGDRLIAWGEYSLNRNAAFVCTFARGQLEKKVVLKRRTPRKSVSGEVRPFGLSCKLSTDKSFTAGEGLLESNCPGRMLHRRIDLISCSDDGKCAVTAYADGTMQVWDAIQGKETGGELRGHSGRVLKVEWAPVGSRFATGGHDAKVKVWGRKNGKMVELVELRLLQASFCSSCCMAWSPNGAHLAYAGEDKMAQLWVFETGDVLQTSQETIGTRCMSWSPDGSVLACGKVGEVYLLEINTRKHAGTLAAGSGSPVACIEWSKDGKQLAAAGDDMIVRVWEVKTETNVATFNCRGSFIRCLRWSSDGTWLVSGGTANTLRRWALQASGEEATESMEIGGLAFCTMLKWSPKESYLATGHSGGDVRIWDLRTGRPVGKLCRSHTSGVKCLDWSLDERHLASGHPCGTIIIWEVPTGEPVRTLPALGNHVEFVAFSPTQSMLAYELTDGRVQIWDVRAEKIRPLDGSSGHFLPRRKLRWSTDEELLITRGKKLLQRYVWNVSTGCWRSSVDVETDESVDLDVSEEPGVSIAKGQSLFYRCNGHETCLATLESDDFQTFCSRSGSYVAVCNRLSGGAVGIFQLTK